MDTANGGYQDSQTNVRTKKRNHNSKCEPRKRKRSNNKDKRSNLNKYEDCVRIKNKKRRKKKFRTKAKHAEENILRLLQEFRLHNFTDQKAALCLGPDFFITRASSKIEQSRAEQFFRRVLFSATPTTIASQFPVANPTFGDTYALCPSFLTHNKIIHKSYQDGDFQYSQH